MTVVETGFRSIFRRDNHWFPRVFWSTVLIVSASVTIYCCYGIIWKYNYEPEFGIKVVQKSMGEVPLPAVTICLPVFAKKSLASYLKLGNIFHSTANFSVKEQNFFAANYQACNPHNGLADYEVVKRHVQNRTDFNVIKLLNESALNVGDFFNFCGLNDAIEDCAKYFRPVLTDSGFCYSFNLQDDEIIFNEPPSGRKSNFHFKFSTKSRKNVTWTLDEGFSPSHGNKQVPFRALKENRFGFLLSLTPEDANNFCPIVGKVHRIAFHLPNEIPTLFHVEHYAAYRNQRNIALTATMHKANENLRRYPPDIRGCYFQNERQLKFYRTYTKAQCDFECLTNYTLETCGCVKFSMPHEASTRICDLEQMQCYAHAMDRWPEEDDGNHIACSCLPNCNNIEYSIKFEKEAVIDYVRELLGKEHMAKNLSDTVIGIRFVDHLAMEYRMFIAYQIENFIADIGGLLGLFLGASLVSFIEVAHIVTHMSLKSMKRGQKIEDTENHDSDSSFHRKFQKMSQVIQILDQNQKINEKRLRSIEERIESHRPVRNSKNDEILMSLEEIIYKNRRQ